MTRILKLESCVDCPYFRTPETSMHPAVCSNTKDESGYWGKLIDTLNGIPEWCPLERLIP